MKVRKVKRMKPPMGWRLVHRYNHDEQRLMPAVGHEDPEDTYSAALMREEAEDGDVHYIDTDKEQ